MKLFKSGITLFCCFLFFNSLPAQSSLDQLEADFNTPPESVKPWCYWYWIEDDISKEGVTKDLEAMKRVGIGAALIGNINPNEVDGRVPILSEAWWETMVHAVNEGHRLGIDIGVFNCPGWSQSGGPWIEADMAMRYKTYSEVMVEGPGPVEVTLPRPADEFQDTYTIAFPQDESIFISDTKNTKISSTPAVKNPEKWLDGDPRSAPAFELKEGASYVMDIYTPEIPARNITLTPDSVQFMCNCTLEAKTAGQFQTVKSFVFDRRKMSPNIGGDLQGPLSISFPAVTSSHFRLSCQDFQAFPFPGQPAPVTVGFSEIALSSGLLLDHYSEKALAKMHPTPFPTWSSYAWESQEDPQQESLYITNESVKDLSSQLQKDGTLKWDVPKGRWIIQRYGMAPTGTRNSPSAPQGKGYEVDKMSEELIRFHFEQFVGALLERIPEKSRPAFKYVIADSYEMGSQNWTDGFREMFTDTYGYDPVPFLPVYAGRVVESVEASERFLWDMRRLVATSVAYEYVGGLRKISNEHNLKLWLENYGHWGFPSEFLMYGGQSNLVSGEFWNEGSLGNIECKASSSAAHIYGKPVTSAEAFTAANQSYLRHPALLRKRGDWSFTEGINHFVLHLYIHQPDDNRKPGVNAWFSTEFNRHNTWFEQGKSWIDYLRRSQVLLQHGRYVADVCYFIGENTPVMTGERNPELPGGYSYDYINAEAILNRVSVRNGQLVLPDGMSYRLLVLPPTNTMRPEVLAKIEALVSQGAAVYGPRPEKSPSYQNYPTADQQVQTMAGKMWGTAGTEVALRKKYGKGMLYNNMDLQNVLDDLKIEKDVDLQNEKQVLWTHRNAPGMDLYFLTNQSDRALQITPSFRTNYQNVQLWNAVDGCIRQLPKFEAKAGRISVPIHFEKDESWFIVFTEEAQPEAPSFQSNFPETVNTRPLTREWKVDFLNKEIGPKKPVTMQSLRDWSSYLDEKIRYYSGQATYTTSFELKDLPTSEKLFLNLGQVEVIASVKINGKEVGTSWMAPHRLDISEAVKKGDNTLEVTVANLWRNKLMQDKKRPEAERYTWISVEDIGEEEKPHPSGLIGSVILEWKK
jgi:hypothetical protein